MRRSTKWVLGFFFGVVALPGLLMVSLDRQAKAALRRHEFDVAAILSEFRATGPPRSPLFGNPLPEKGWPLYLQAMDAMESMTNDERATIPEMEFTLSDPDDAEIAAVWARYAPVVEVLRRAVKCGDQSVGDSFPGSSGLKSGEDVLGFLLGGAAHLHRLGKDPEAFDLLVLYTAVARDTRGRIPEGSGWSPVTDEKMAAKGLQFLEDHTLSSRDLEELAGRLDLHAAARPPVSRQYRLLDAQERRKALEGRLQGWEREEHILVRFRHLYLPSVATAAALRDIEDYYGKMIDVERIPVDKREAATEGLGPPWRRGAPPSNCVKGSNSLYYADVRSIASLSLLRLAVGLAWYETENGRFPDKLKDLEPRYVGPETLNSASLRVPLSYSGGTMTGKGVLGNTEWSVKRR